MAAETVRQTTIALEDVTLYGDVGLPGDTARGLVVFAHGSGSSRHSSRNQYVAAVLRDADLATLLFDLLTESEEDIDQRSAELRFNIPFLAGRLTAVSDWLGEQEWAQGLRIGYFGASTGAAAAIITAADRPETAGAVVSRGGRPDLAGDALHRVRAPTLLIVGGADTPVIEMNRSAFEHLREPKRLEIVPGATHLFEEPGALEQVGELATNWFTEHLAQTT